MYQQMGFPGLTPGVKNLIFANVAVYIFQVLSRHALDIYFILWPSLVLKKFFIWQLVTYMFFHGGVGHIFFNMFALWMFGSVLERTWGTREFIKYYFLTGISAGIFITLFTSNPTLGASGAIYGILMAFALFFPEEYVYLYFLFPIKMKYLAVIIGALEFLSLYSNDGIAHTAHLGGMIVGYFYLRHRYRYLGIGRNFFRNFFRKKY